MNRYKAGNNRSVVAWYSLILVIGAVFFGIFVDKRYYYIMYIAVAVISVGYFLLVRSRTYATIEVLYLRGNVEEILNYYKRTIRIVPRAKLWRAYTNSIALALFGKFDAAEAEIEKMNTVGMAPMFEGMRQNAKSLVYYLKRTDYSAGLLCARNARELSAVGKAVPGRKTSMNAYDAYVEMGMILTGKADQKVVETLEGRFESSLFLLKLPIAWTLAGYCRERDQAKFEKYQDFLKRSAPSCRPLHEYS